MSQSYNWTIYSSKERHAGIEQVKRDIQASRGDILQFTRFSDQQHNLMIEIKEHRLPSLLEKLAAWAEVTGTEGVGRNCTARPSVLYLCLNFSKGTKDLEHPLPAD